MNDNSNFDFERHAHDFLNYAAEHKKEIIILIYKNLTANPGVDGHEVFSEVCLKCYETIMRGKKIDDFKSYLFIACRFKFCEYTRKYRDKINSKAELDEIPDCIDDFEDVVNVKTERENKSIDKLNCLRDCLSEEFGSEWAEIFLDYFGRKPEDYSFNYSKLAAEWDQNPAVLKRTMAEMRKYVNEQFIPFYEWREKHLMTCH